MRPNTLLAAAAALVALTACHQPEFVAEPTPACAGRTVTVKDEPLPEWDGKSWAIHEWGTFTAVQGSDGVVLDGLSHDETDLPEFVHDIRDFTCVEGVSPKMETPVIYFYGPEARRVSVDVKFPRGVITQWYPAAGSINHLVMLSDGAARTLDGQEITDLDDGHISWNNGLRVLAPGQAKDGSSQIKVQLPTVDETDPWRFCREVDANTLCACRIRQRAIDGVGVHNGEREYERCLFYRGLGDFEMPLTAEVGDETLLCSDNNRLKRPTAVKVNVKLVNQNPAEPLRHVMLIYKDKNSGRAGFHYIESLDDEVELKDFEIELALGDERTAAALADKLTQTGLYGKEALAMVNTWREGYIDNSGFRVLYVLPTAFVDRELPLEVSGWGAKADGKITQAPIVRTFVARLELLTPSLEAELEAAVKAVAQSTKEFELSRQQALAELDSWGRFAIPYFNRVRELSKDKDVLAEVEKRLEAHKLKR